MFSISKYLTRLSYFAAMALTLGSTSCIFNTGTIRTARPPKNAQTIMIGPIENRDPKLNVDLSRNFTDRIVFELADKGFDPFAATAEELNLVLPGHDGKANPPPVQRKSQPEPQPKGKTDDEDIPETTEPTVVLPENLRNLAGEAQSDMGRTTIGRLDRAAIIRLARAGGFKFFIQGAISRTEQGILLDTKENSFVFLEVWTADGRRLGLVHYSVHDRSLFEAQLLDVVAPKIADAVALTISSPGR